ncbi:YbaB/EbfC family nucleoid-associated protein [Nonomuraea turkmeniaca]|uniref:YbaB/EbfC family nucleoid-associated protein n=1 Tax=Nonomuraea turkmeniaca TaxID=103838 RepID=A0A5S4EVG9_9ACTN|nr:YbaB/EbfC family nucleoid-associated protein [Nonomuraea turkmeniaca]TMR07578.1 YbaB/EbfC family nucleoid-associated protein [Nonomuraea turkmeniaca]
MKEIEAFAEGREGDLAGLLREINEWTGTLAGRMNDLAQERLEGTDAGGVVRARVSGAGRLLGLAIDSRGLRGLDNVQLAEAVKEAIGAAHTAMGDRLTELMADLPGADASAQAAGDPLAPHIARVLREG